MENKLVKEIELVSKCTRVRKKKMFDYENNIVEENFRNSYLQVIVD